MTPIEILNVMIHPEDGETKDFKTTTWNDGEYSYSCDGACLLRVKGVYGVHKDSGKFPSVANFDFDLISGEDAYIVLPESFEFCQECSPNTSVRAKTRCTTCGGSGQDECPHCGQEMECEDCDGSGEMTGPYPTKSCPFCFGTRVAYGSTPIKIGQKWFGHRYIALLTAKLQNVRFYPEATVIKQPKGWVGIGFAYDGGVGALMESMPPDKTNTVEE